MRGEKDERRHGKSKATKLLELTDHLDQEVILQ